MSAPDRAPILPASTPPEPSAEAKADPGPEEPSPRRAAPARLSETLTALVADESRERIAVADLVAELGNRAFGPLLVIFALPNLIPAPPGTSTILGLPLIFLTFQMLFGSRPWFPGFIAKRSLRRVDFKKVIDVSVPHLARAERLLRPRLLALSSPLGQKALGFVCLCLATLLVLPIPFGNTAPSIAMALIGLALVERDGLWITAGLGVAIVAVFLVYGVVWTMARGALLLVSNFFA